MLTVHHLGHSQSDRVVWLCEELGIPYELRKYDRSPLLAPEEYKALHPIGSAPVIEDDGGIKLAESGACIEYIVHTHGGGRLVVEPGQPGYVDYLYWFHFANGTLQPTIGRDMALRWAGVSAEGNETAARYLARARQCFAHLDARIGDTKAWLAGPNFTAADIITVFSLTGMREFCPYDLSEYRNVLDYLKRVSEREGYRSAFRKGDPDIDVESLIQGPAPLPFKALRK